MQLAKKIHIFHLSHKEVLDMVTWHEVYSFLGDFLVITKSW
jgi:hypothetical protein